LERWVVGMISEDWLVVSALVQAVAAVVIGAFTIALWRSTSKLAEATKRDVELTEQIARIQTIVSAKELARAAPRLIAMFRDRTVTEDRVDQEIEIENDGGASAYAIEVETSWGTPVIAGPLLPGSSALVAPVIARSAYDTLPDPENEPMIERFRFKDSQGVVWKQFRGEVPIRVED
jgi:hypothetical protein